MKARDRHSRILAALAREGRVSVTELARDHDVTVETIRRDLAVLDRAGALRKIHGGALPAPVLAAPETGVLQRERDHAEAKARIARAALTALDPREGARSEEHTSELQSRQYLVCRLLLEKKKYA